jgi:hypothetical protein
MPQPDGKPQRGGEPPDLVTDGGYIIGQRIPLSNLPSPIDMGERDRHHIPSREAYHIERQRRAETAKANNAIARRKVARLALAKLEVRVRDGEDIETRDLVQVAKLDGTDKESGDTNVTIADKAMIIRVVRE